MTDTELIARLKCAAELIRPDGAGVWADLYREAAAALAAQAQEIERVSEQRDKWIATARALKELEHEAHLQRGDAVDREELASDNNDLLLGENAELRQRAEECDRLRAEIERLRAEVSSEHEANCGAYERVEAAQFERDRLRAEVKRLKSELIASTERWQVAVAEVKILDDILNAFGIVESDCDPFEYMKAVLDEVERGRAEIERLRSIRRHG